MNPTVYLTDDDSKLIEIYCRISERDPALAAVLLVESPGLRDLLDRAGVEH